MQLGQSFKQTGSLLSHFAWLFSHTAGFPGGGRQTVPHSVFTVQQQYPTVFYCCLPSHGSRPTLLLEGTGGNLPSYGIRSAPVVGCLEASDVRNPDIPFHCAEYCSCDGCMRSTWDGWAVTLKLSPHSTGTFCGFSWVATFCYLVEEGSEGTTPWLCSWCLSTGYTLVCWALVRLLGKFLLPHNSSFGTKQFPVCEVRVHNSEKICFLPQGLVLS